MPQGRAGIPACPVATPKVRQAFLPVVAPKYDRHSCLSPPQSTVAMRRSQHLRLTAPALRPMMPLLLRRLSVDTTSWNVWEPHGIGALFSTPSFRSTSRPSLEALWGPDPAVQSAARRVDAYHVSFTIPSYASITDAPLVDGKRFTTISLTHMMERRAPLPQYA
jgi:hypothetical protein